MNDEEKTQLMAALKKIDESVDRLILANQQNLVAQWLSVVSTAKYCQVSEDHVRRAIYAGKLTASNMGTPDLPLYRISRVSIEEWLRSKEIGRKASKGRTKTAKPSEYVNPFYK